MAAEGAEEALHAELGALIADEKTRKEFIELCLTHLITIGYDKGI